MSTVPTMKVKADGDRGFKLINVSDYDPKKHEAFDDEAKAALDVNANLTGAERKLMDERAAQKKVDGNFGQVAGNVQAGDGGVRNPSGTFSEPTPTDIRYPDKTATEFENNAGAFIGRSAAGLRAEVGLPDVPGGIKPAVHEQVKADQDAAEIAAARAAKDAKNPRRDQPVAMQAAEAKAAADANVDLATMTNAELRAHAAERGIDLGDATRKEDIRSAIERAGK